MGEMKDSAEVRSAEVQKFVGAGFPRPSVYREEKTKI